MEIRDYDFYEEFQIVQEVDLETETEEDLEDVGQPEVKEEFNFILQQAKEKAEFILEAAHQEAKIIQQKAEQEGYALGETKGYRDGLEKAAALAKVKYDEEIGRLEREITGQVVALEEEKQQMLENYMEDLKSISLAIGEKIVQTSLKSSEAVIERMILSAVEKMKKVAWAKIYIANTAETKEIQGDVEFLRSLAKLSDNVKVILMEDAEVGTCIVETPEEVLDISVKTQLENIKEILNNARV